MTEEPIPIPLIRVGDIKKNLNPPPATPRPDPPKSQKVGVSRKDLHDPTIDRLNRELQNIPAVQELLRKYRRYQIVALPKGSPNVESGNTSEGTGREEKDRSQTHG